MIAAIIAAGLLTLAQSDRAATISALADELEATGGITCEVSAEEQRLRDVTMARLVHSMNVSDLLFDRAPFGCVVLRFQVLPSGSAVKTEVVRQKGIETLVIWTHTMRFQPGDHEWTGLAIVQTRGEPEQIAKGVAWFRRQAAASALQGQTPPAAN